MSNEVRWLVFIIVDLSLAILAFRIWGKNGLYAMIAVGVVICNIQVIK
jgi:hypothetical protein